MGYGNYKTSIVHFPKKTPI